MIKYLEAKTNRKLVVEFIKYVDVFFEIEDQIDKSMYYDGFPSPSERREQIQSKAIQNEEYQNLREKIAKSIQKIMKLGKKYRVATAFKCIPPPMVGGVIIPQNIIYAILVDSSYQGVDKQLIRDTLMQIEGACEEQEKKAFRKLINPLCWIRDLFLLIIRLPFILVSLSGFNVSKVEDHFLGKAFKLLEVVFIVLALLELGVSKEKLIEFLANILN